MRFLTLGELSPVETSDSTRSGALLIRDDTQIATNQVRSFTYQDYQYFLTTGSSPNAWGSRTWAYDAIGNRLRSC